MPVRPLPSSPNLAHLKHQAKDLLRDHAARLPASAQRIREFNPRYAHATDDSIFAGKLGTSDAQLVVARERGFPSWARLKHHLEAPTLADRLDLPHHERIADPLFQHAVELIDTGFVAGLRDWLRQHPRLVHQHVLFEGANYFRSPSLLEFVAENPVRHGKLPTDIVQVAQVILQSGPDKASRNETLMLAATGSVVRECKVQRPLIALLCSYGADPNSAIRSAALLGEPDSVQALLEEGADLDLPVAAALGRLQDCKRLITQSNSDDRHLALALASQYGQTEVVRMLLTEGERADRYNPPGGHSHATPLHQAAASGHLAVVQLLLEHGAHLDLRDVLWHGTPADWAHHEGKTEVEAFLRGKEREQPKNKHDAPVPSAKSS